MALRSTQPLTEMSTGNLPGGKERLACKAVSWLSRKFGSLDVSQFYGPRRPATEIVLTFYHTAKPEISHHLAYVILTF
jgi:hypothetical protein